MGSYRYKDDGVFSSVVNYIISGVFFLAGIVFFILTANGLSDLAPFMVIFCGIALSNLFTVKAIYEDYNMTNKFVRFLLSFAGVIGALLLFAGAGASVSSPFPYVKVLAFSVLIGAILKVFIENIADFIPAFSAPESDFFKYYSFLIFAAATLLFFSVLYFFFDFYFTLLFLGNWILVYFILTDFRSWMEEKKTSYLIYAIVFFVIGVGINLPIALAVNGLASSAFDIATANLFNLASNLYFALALIMGIGFTFLTRLDSIKYNMSNFAIEILLLVIPVLSFGVQFLAFYYFEAFLIVAGAVLLLTALVVCLFKLFIIVVSAIGEFFVEAAKAIWYVISFKWITNQIDVLTSSSGPSKSTPQGNSTPPEDSQDTNCKGCAYYTICTNPKTDMPNCDYCLLKNEVLSYGEMLCGCENFKKG